LGDRKAVPSGVRLSLGRALLFSLGGIPASALGVALLVYLPPHLTSHLGVSLAVVGGSWAIVRFLDIIVDPILGVLMDRTSTRFGRYRVWLVIGAPIMMVSVWMLFMARPGISQVYLVGWLLVLYLAQSIIHLAHPAWGATLASDYDDRSRIFGVVGAVGVLSAVTMLALPAVAAGLGETETQGVHLMGWFLVLSTPVVVGIAVFFTGERVAPQTQSQRPSFRDYVALLTKPDLARMYAAIVALTLGPGWMSALYIFFAKDFMHFTTGQASVLLLVYMGAGLLGAPLGAQLAIRIGKHRALQAAAVAYSLGLCVVLLPPKGMLLASMPVMIWCGFMGAAFELLIRAMLADVADQVRLEQGRERLSLIYALNTLAAKIAGAVSILISYPLLQWFGYLPRAGALNTPQAISALGWVFIAGPIFFVLLGAACVVGWKLTSERHAEIRTELEVRDALAAGIGG
jgi:GPH family glycoside/pentoside/hexuronide:cation symporter